MLQVEARSRSKSVNEKYVNHFFQNECDHHAIELEYITNSSVETFQSWCLTAAKLFSIRQSIPS